MKISIITVIILGIFAAYFVFNVENSISVKGGGNAIPAGIDVARFILDYAKTISPGKIIGDIIDSGKEININKSGKVLKSDIVEEVKSQIIGIKEKILSEGINLIKQPIKDKAIEAFCPQN